MPFIPNTDRERQEMLKVIGVSSFEDLIKSIPESIRFHGKLNLPAPLSEQRIYELLREIAHKNKPISEYLCFLGGGAYDHFIPAAVEHIISRPEFYTAYTPYQPEVSQGTLQTIYEYQTMICNLTGMEVANASLYDGGSALAEAALMACSHTNRKQLVLSRGINPHYLEVIKTYCQGQNIIIKEADIEEGVTDVGRLKSIVDEKTAGVIVQHPNFFGCLEEVEEIGELAHQKGALFITSNDPISLGILKPPGEYGADIATGEGQPLGNPLSFGGPYLGIFAARKGLVRKMPGRIVGATLDTQGRRGFVLTLQTREQHIRRERATSNICTNQALNALAATVYLALMGKQGIREVADLCLQKSHYLAREIEKIDGFGLKFKRPFFKEFVLHTPISPGEIIRKLKEEKILAGVDLGRYGWRNCLLVAVTEKRTKQDMDRYLEALRRV